MLSKPTFIVSILLIVASIGLFYFLNIPNFEEISTQAKEIEDIWNSLLVHDVCDLKFKGQDILELTNLRKNLLRTVLFLLS